MLLNSYFKQKREERRAEIRRALLHHEANVGGQLFGPIPEGHRREFFCLDEHTWVWHEEWTDARGQRQIMTTRYEVRPAGVFKAQGVNQYQPVAGQEERHFRAAVDQYMQQVTGEYQRLLAA